MDSGKTEPPSPPEDTETQDTSPKQGMQEDQPEMGLESKECHVHETMKGEEIHTSELENRVSADCDSRPEEGTEKMHLSGGNAQTPAGYKNDIVISKEERHLRERPPALTEESLTHQCQNGAKSSPSSTKDAELKLKPSCETARQYVPNGGLTTRTIGPSKSLEKRKYFEVELTLEAPAVALIGSPKPANHSPETDEPHVSVGQPERSITQGEGLFNGNVIIENTDSGHTAPTLPAPDEVPEADGQNCQPSSSNDGAFGVGPHQEIKENKIPPAIKPKPDSFHLPQQTRTSAEYATSAAMKNNPRAISHCGQEEESGRAGIEKPMDAKEENSFPPPPRYPPISPPPPPPHAGQEATERLLEDELKSTGMSRPGDGNTKYTTNERQQPAEPSLKKLTSSATPKLYEHAEPSPFSKAVFAAIKRSQRFPSPTQPPASKTLVSGIIRTSVDGEK
ncbi:hypothetical protein SKAU_G00258440 [Synaphobranchus kaupii]|uniref:Uncharacterized protein n=1 Tax=Synaphobranchus kaupii TaxID=118154 RepID=A0A9Q1F493_SYNKA|nr:hypothetical protein SKAU_G00258440 [Synaphobranchus kaupii]